MCSALCKNEREMTEVKSSGAFEVFKMFEHPIKKGQGVTLGHEEWPVQSSSLYHDDRILFMREIAFEMPSLNCSDADSHEGHALSLNLSSGGILLLMDVALQPEQVIKVHIPTPVNPAQTPTLAEVRWSRRIPLDTTERLYFIGLRFVL
jgi:hypothetical protein